VDAIWFNEALIGREWRHRVRIEIAGGLIASITPDADPEPDDARHATGLPGMANLHSHAFQRAMAGLAEYRASATDDFWSWRDIMYRFANAITPEQLEAIATFAFIEMLEAGFTRVGEFHYVHHQADGAAYEDPAEMSARIAAAAANSGIALTLLPVFYAHSGFGGAPPEEKQRRFVNSTDSFGRLLDSAARALTALPDAVLGVAPHSLRAVTLAQLREVSQMRADAPVHIHIAEQMKEVEDCRAWSGARPVEWLMDNVDVGPRWCLVHATHVSDAELDAIVRSRAVAGLCPITEANLGDGIFPAAAYLNAGGAFGVGTDSNVRIGLAEELRTLEYGQRLIERKRCVLASADLPSVGETLFLGAIEGGAQALGAEPHLHVGGPAEIVALRGAQDAVLDRWIFTRDVQVDSVWRRGVQLVTGGRHRGRGEAERRFRSVVEELRAL
jgi:formimidoylglutamate deiminase